MLAKQARKELRITGQTRVVCPKCNKSPEMATTAGGERTTIECECGYIFLGEINL